MVPDADSADRFSAPVTAHSSDAFESSHGLPATFDAIVRAAARGELVELSSLRALLRAHISAAKEGGDPPERAIGALRALTSAGVDRDQRTAHSLLWQVVVGWCLDDYFGPYYGQYSEMTTRTDRESPVRREVTRSD